MSTEHLTYYLNKWCNEVIQTNEKIIIEPDLKVDYCRMVKDIKEILDAAFKSHI